MQHNKLSSSLVLGAVELYVQNIKIMKDFYKFSLGLDLIREEEKKVVFGMNNKPLLVLHQKEGLSKANPTEAGLYHFAILFSSRGDLARTVYSILKQKPHSFTGSADHLVSEAFYFSDPEGNGIELYYDRDRSDWQWENNQVKMATLYINPIEYLNKHRELKENDSNIQMGHFHLKVGSIEAARRFYAQILGFDITAELPGALFISVGGYHHHVGLNTWESEGASKRTDSLGLKTIEFFLPHKADLDLLKKRLKDNSVEFVETDTELLFHDPWHNQIVFCYNRNKYEQSKS